MILPENGSVVVIDDRPEEALPIIRALSKRGISVTYFSGNNPDEFPPAPLSNVRIAFLDLQLVESSDSHQIEQGVLNVLRSILSPQNGPYILIVWSKNYAKYGEGVANLLNKEPHLRPSTIVSFKKRDCLEERRIEPVDLDLLAQNVFEIMKGRMDEEDLDFLKEHISQATEDFVSYEFEAKPNTIEIIENNLKVELEKAGVFHLFVIWENLVKSAAAKTVYAISSAINGDEHWELNMRDVFRRMGVARIGQNKVDEETLLRESLLTFVQSFTDHLDSGVKSQELPAYITTKATSLLNVMIEADQYSLGQVDQNFFILKNDIEIFAAKGLDGLKKSIEKQKKSKEREAEAAVSIITSYESIPVALNTGLHLEIEPTLNHVPGNIFEIEVDQEKKMEYLGTYFGSIGNEDSHTVKFIELEVSPICDYAQEKWKKSRLLSGIIYPINLPNLQLKNGDHLYPVRPTFLLEGKMCKMVFDYHLFKSLDHDLVKNRKIKFRLKRELLLDIIAKLSAHVNRPGISFIQ